MTNLDPLLERNRTFAETEAHVGLTPMPRHQVFVLTCMDSRIDPAHIFGLALGDALVMRNGGGRVNDDVIAEVAFIGQVTEMMSGDSVQTFEVAILHHTSCGTGFLADDDFRNRLAARVGVDSDELASHAVVDPEETVRLDVERLRRSRSLPAHAVVSGHVYDVDTGLVRTVVPPQAEGKGEGR